MRIATRGVSVVNITKFVLDMDRVFTAIVYAIFYVYESAQCVLLLLC